MSRAPAGAAKSPAEFSYSHFVYEKIPETGESVLSALDTTTIALSATQADTFTTTRIAAMNAQQQSVHNG